jgi:hypothetical protein
MIGLTEVGPHVDFDPYVKSLVDLAEDVLDGRKKGKGLEYHKDSGWSLTDIAESERDLNINGYGWSIDFRGALDTLSERQFESPRQSVRENIQNARDAKPKTGIYISPLIDESTTSDNKKITYYVIEDGEGMNIKDLGEYLFRIFSSPKRGNIEYAGEHGIGFVSNLAYSEAIVVDTKKQGEKPITVVIKGKYKGDEERDDRYEIQIFEGTRQIPGTTVSCLNFDEKQKKPTNIGLNLNRIVADLAKYLDIPCYVKTEVIREFKAVNKEFDKIKLKQRLEFETPEIRRGVIGISPLYGLDLLQNGLGISRFDIKGLSGIVDAVNITPLIGRTGFVNDENYMRLMKDILKQVTVLAGRIAEKPILEAYERLFLRAYLEQFSDSWGLGLYFPEEVKEGIEIPDSVRVAKIFPTPFNRQIQLLDQRIGKLTVGEQELRYNLLLGITGKEDFLHVSLDEIARSVKEGKTIFHAETTSTKAEDLRKQRYIVLKDIVGGKAVDVNIGAVLSHFIDDFTKHYKRVAGFEEDIEYDEYPLDDLTRSFQELLTETTNADNIDVVLARFKTKKGEPLTDIVAANAGSLRDIDITTTYINMNCELNQRLLEAYGKDPNNPLARLGVQALMHPIMVHEEAHSLGFNGHDVNFYFTYDSLLLFRQRQMITSLLEVLSGGDKELGK